jgi:hypothetical protein
MELSENRDEDNSPSTQTEERNSTPDGEREEHDQRENEAELLGNFAKEPGVPQEVGPPVRLQTFLREHKGWVCGEVSVVRLVRLTTHFLFVCISRKGIEILVEKYAVSSRRHGTYPNLVLFKYDQIGSPLGDLMVQECRGVGCTINERSLCATMTV